MAYYNKIGLLVLNYNRDKFLVCQKYAHNVTADYIMPGGKNDEDDDVECLTNEIKQELDCELDIQSLDYLGTYEDTAAGFIDRTVEMRLYEGRILGEPKPSKEVEFIHWIGAKDQNNPKVSSIIRRKIIPDLLKRNILAG